MNDETKTAPKAEQTRTPKKGRVSGKKSRGNRWADRQNRDYRAMGLDPTPYGKRAKAASAAKGK